jgi:antitoxin PrlF
MLPILRTSVVTRKGQVTIPIEIRRALGLEEGDQVLFRLAGGKTELLPGASVTSLTAGSLANDIAALSPREERIAAEEAIAEEAAGEGL